MRANTLPALLLSLLAAGACGDNSDTSTSTGTTAAEHCSEGFGDGPTVAADYPACRCAPDRCDEGSACRSDGPTPAFTSSVCAPACDSLQKCPELGSFKPACENGWCILRCGECPEGYVCASDQTCQVKLE